MPAALEEGDKAPNFTLTAQDGRRVSLSDYFGKKNVVLYFYPKDFTAGCTAETRAFGASYGDLTALGAEVIGVSADPEESHWRFAIECSAPFVLLSDPGRKVGRLYGVRGALGLVPGRVTFVIDRDGVVRRVFSSQLNPKKHVAEAIESLRAMV